VREGREEEEKEEEKEGQAKGGPRRRIHSLAVVPP